MSMAMVSGVATETVSFTSDRFTITAFLAHPAGSTNPSPGLLVLHEWWGLTDHIKDVARRLAQEGFAVLAPDLYARQGAKVTQNPQEASALMNAVSSQATLRDLNAATKYFKSQPCVDPLSLGLIGFSMGGTFAITQATHNSDGKAAVSFYGKVPPIETFRYLLCPLQYHYPAKDGWVTAQEVEVLRQGLAKQGKPGEVHVYPEASHAFFNDSRPEVYRADDARLAWDLTLKFFTKHLR